MATLSQDTYAASGLLLSGVGGGGSQISTFSTFTVSSLNVLQLNAFDAYIGNLSSVFFLADEAYISSLSTLAIDLDGNLLTTAGAGGNAELLLNGVPVATTENISSLADWSFDPAISTVNMNANNIIGANQIRALTVNAPIISTTNIYAEGPETNYLLALEGATLNLNAQPITDQQGGVIQLTSGPDEGTTGGLITLEAQGGGQAGGPSSDGRINLITTTGPTAVGNPSQIFMSTGNLNIEADEDITADVANVNLNAAYSASILVDAVDDIGNVNQINITGENNFRGEVNIFAGTGNNNTNAGIVNIGAGGGTTYGRIRLISRGTTNGPGGLGGEITLRATDPTNPGVDDSFINLIANQVQVRGQPIGLLEGLEGVSTYTAGILSVETLANVSTINGQAYPPPAPSLTSSFTTASISSLTASQIIATQDLTVNATRYISETSRGYSNAVDRGIDVGGNAFYRVTAGNGNRGEISLTANPGAGGIYGEINLTANGGTTPGLIGSGGLINITANTPIGTDPALTSAVKISAAGINSYAGAVPNVGSLLGYNFIYGTLGVNLCAGLPSIIPNTPGTIYLYGTTGITLGSQTNTASDITQSAGGLYTTLLTGYWGGIPFAPQNLAIRGRQTVAGNSYVTLSNVTNLACDNGAITGVTSINGSAYPPVFEPPANAVVSTLTAANQISTPALFVSSVNGAVYPPPVIISPNLVVSTLTAADYVSTGSIYGVSTVCGGSVTNNIIFVEGGGITINNDGSDMVIDNAGSLQVRTDLIIPTYELIVSSIRGVSSINGQVYPPTFEPPANAVVSTLTAAVQVSTPELFVSSVNGAAYPPAGSTIISPDLVVSSLTAAVDVITFALSADTVLAPVYVSTPALRVSSINGYQPNRPVVSSLNVGPRDQAGTDFEAGIHTYTSIYLQDEGADNIDTGVLTLRRTTGSYTEPNSAPILSAFTVDAFSTLGATLPIIASRIYLNNGPGATAVATPISGDTAGNIVIPFSSIIGISTINGAAYPPAASIPANLTVSTLTAANQVSTPALFVSSVNGQIYPPPSAGGSPNAEFSTVTVSSFVSAPVISNVSSINDVNFNGGNINAQILEAQSGFNLAGAGTFTINGSTGGEGQVIQIIDGYPAWATPVRPSAYYSTSTESLPVFSTFSTVVSQVFTTQLSTGNCLVTGNLTFLNGDIIGDTLTTNLFLTGSGAGTAISTTGGFAAGYQNISLQYLIPQASLNPPGTPNTFEINIKKPDTDNSYTVTYATISVTTDLN